MNKFIILGEQWSDLIANAKIQMIMATTVPPSLEGMETLADYLSSTHEDLFIRAYNDDITDKCLIGILKPTPNDLKDLIPHETLILQAKDILLEIELDETKHLTVVEPKEQNELYASLSGFLRKTDKTLPIKKRKNDN
jgi:hypothetical protein